ncbi:hypothetical protein HK097_008627 [Rhizophlyctis rosea]|uniref:J domain-containing protein n=1 Tax=Rhizophlyctis rosea TaxID=64517 RepID=A0AAD5X561_9FUNG|nr:hypothetical protein HK097_008627 [Rhizophlyctis rosea]
MTSLKKLCWLFLAVCLLALLPAVAAWEQEDVELFEMNDNLQKLHPNTPVDFYSILNVDRKASLPEIIKAHRKTSLQLHPDKNPDPKARELYSHLTSIVGVLKDPKKRERYDGHLQRGLPRWRGQGYFYNRYTPGVGTVLFLLLLAASFVQYVTSWIKYLLGQAQAKEEKAAAPQLTYAQVMKQLKKSGADIDKRKLKKATPEELAQIAATSGSADGSGTVTPGDAELRKPSLSDTLVVTLSFWVVRKVQDLATGRKAAKDGEDGVGDQSAFASGQDGANGLLAGGLRQKARRNRSTDGLDTDLS